MANAGRAPGTPGRIHATELDLRFRIVPPEEVYGTSGRGAGRRLRPAPGGDGAIA